MNQVCLCLLVLGSFCCAGVALAAPPSEQTQACVAASTQGQTDRDEGHLLAARAQFLSCAREICPKIVKKSCAGWLTELGERIPSVVVRVHEARQRDLTEARATLDGKAITLDGRSVALDPGTHELAVKAQGYDPVERTFLVAEREQGRLLVLELKTPGATLAQAAPVQAEAMPERPTPLEPTRAQASTTPEPSSRYAPEPFSVPIAGWVLGGLGVAELVSFVALRSKAQSDLHTLQRTCSPTCSDQQRDAGKRKALIADVSLGIGVTAFAVAGAWTLGSWFSRRNAAPAEPRTATLSLVPTRGGAFAALEARY